MYTIKQRFGVLETLIEARSAQEALEKAETIERSGQPVQVTTPAGETLDLTQFRDRIVPSGL
jgi:hypothetical protein